MTNTNNMSLSVASMFAGIGCMRLGFKQASFKIVWVNERDRVASNTYRHNFGDGWLCKKDIRNVNPQNIPNFDVLTAGFYCQPFSGFVEE